MSTLTLLGTVLLSFPAWGEDEHAEAVTPPATVVERPRPEPREEPEREPSRPHEDAAPALVPRAGRMPRAGHAELDARLTFLEERIGAQRTHAEIWWGGWLTFYTVGAVVQGARAMDAKEPAEQADLWISAIKATGGAIKYMAVPFDGIEDFEPRPSGTLSREQKAARVRRGERILVHNADKTEAGGPWYAHVINIGINALGGVIVAVGFDDPKTGLFSAALGIAVGEVAILSAPWEADDDLAEYRQRSGHHGHGARPRETAMVRWRVQPTSQGAMIVGRF